MGLVCSFSNDSFETGVEEIIKMTVWFLEFPYWVDVDGFGLACYRVVEGRSHGAAAAPGLPTHDFGPVRDTLISQEVIQGGPCRELITHCQKDGWVTD